MERPQGLEPGETRGSNEGDLIPEVPGHSQGSIGTDPHLGGQVASGPEPTLDHGGRCLSQCDEVGPGAQPARSEQGAAGGGNHEGQEYPRGDDHLGTTPSFDQQIPCHQDHGGDLHLPHPDVQAGPGPQDNRGRPDVGIHESAGSFSFVGGGGDVCQAPSATTRPAGPEGCSVTEATATQREQAQRVLRLNILNNGNYCYANSLVKCLLMLECHHGRQNMSKLIPEPLQGILRGFMNARKPFALWDNPFWKTFVRGWRNPGIQHDVADFLMFLGRCCPELRVKLGARWAARTQGVLRDVDEGWSLPLSICPTGAILWGAECVSVQDLIDGWTSQAEAHALTVASDVIVIQAGRFSSTPDRPVCKLRHFIIPNRDIVVPIFRQGLDTSGERYALSSILIHRGDTPSTGHYQALLLEGTNFFLADDAQVAQPCTPNEVDDTCRDSYLFFYCKGKLDQREVLRSGVSTGGTWCQLLRGTSCV